MQSNTHYHALPTDGGGGGGFDNDDDDDASSADLWDQLNDEQSREVQQHQSRFHAAPPYSSRNQPGVVLWSMAQTTAERVGNSTVSALAAARQAWNHSQNQQHPGRGGQRRYSGFAHPYNNSSDSRSAAADLDLLERQFGLQDLQPTNFEESPIHTTTSTTTTATQSTTTIPQSQQQQQQQQQQRTPLQRPQSPNGKPNPGYPFVMLQNFPRQAISSARDHWGIVANMDVFLQHLYQYYYHRGLVPMVCKFLVEFVSLLFTLWLSLILMKDVDWKLLATCKDEKTCETNWSDYYRKDSTLSWTHWWLIQGYTSLLLAYAFFSVWSFWQSLQHAWTCQYIVHDKLGISKRKLQGGAVAWDTVVQKLLQAQDSGEYRMALRQLDPLLIAQRIMRKENFLIAFWNQNLLDVKVGNRDYWCPSLEWCLHTCVLNFMFNHKYEIRPAFYLDAVSLKRRLQVCGVVHALLLPFLILFVLLHFLLRNVYDFKTTQQYMGNKEWSMIAQWKFREFNELPHVLEQRLEPSYEAAENYIKLFGASEWLAAIGKLLVFLGGAMGGVLLVLGVMNDAILLHVQLWGRNLLWYAGIAGIVYSIGKGLLPSKEAQPKARRGNLFADMDAALKNVSTHTHYYPETWKGRGWDSKVYGSFSELFDSKVKLFAYELQALVLAPYILVFQLSNCAPAICEFCLAVKSRVQGVGDLCGYSTFDFDTFKDEAWEGRTLGKSIMPPDTTIVEPTESLTQSIMRTGNVEDVTRHHPKPRARQGKMEKSFFSFQAAHPNFKCPPSGQSLVVRFEEYRKAELAAISRERELHIDAAARQLETLARLEEKEHSPHPTTATKLFHEERLFDSHVPRVPPADAGAGSQPQNLLRHQQQHQALPRTQQHPTYQPPSSSSPSAFLSTRPRSEITETTSTLPFAGEYNASAMVASNRLSNSIAATLPPTIPELLAQPSADSTQTAFSVSPTTSSHSRGTLRAGLSTELRRLLTMSTLDASEAVLQESSPTIPNLLPTMTDRTAERQVRTSGVNCLCLSLPSICMPN